MPPSPFALRQWLLPGIAGFIFGGLAVAALKANSSADPQPSAAQAKAIQGLEEECSLLRKQLKSALTLAASTTIPISQASKPAPPPKAEIPSVVLTSLKPMGSGKTMREILSDRLDVFAIRLQLNPSQKAYARQRFEQAVDSIGSSGGLTWQALEAEIAAQLSAEQQAEYATFREEQLNAKIEMAANSELNRIQRSVGLSEEQKEAVFQKLAEIQSSLLDTQTGERRTLPPEEMGVLRRKALAEILTVEQLQLLDRHFQSHTRSPIGAP